MASDQDKNKDMNIDEEEIVEVENDDNKLKKPTFRYRNDDVKQKSSLKRTLAFLKTWSWLLVSILLLITILLMVINHFTETMKDDQGDKNHGCVSMC